MNWYRSFLRLSLGILILAVGCTTKRNADSKKNDHDELLEDEQELAAAFAEQKKVKSKVMANTETEPVEAGHLDDAADDPAIWFNEANPSESVVFGSNKKGGIAAYRLDGTKKHYYKLGNVNNVDVLKGYVFLGKSIDLLGGTNRTKQGVELFQITKEGELKEIALEKSIDTAGIDDVYGFCFGKALDGTAYAFINAKNGLVRQYVLHETEEKLGLKLVREFKLESQPEGMVVSEKRQELFVGEEQKGIWQMSLHPDSTSRTLIPMSGEENQNIKFDVEGLTILEIKDAEWLIASSQGNFSYAVFDLRDEQKYVGSFIISEGSTSDGAEETDGIDVITDSLSPEYPGGMFVAQDGLNFDGESPKAQNFKFVNSRHIVQLFKNQ